MSRRQDIIDELKDRLDNITVANGYQTDAGALVLVGQAPALSETDPQQALALIIGADSVGYQGEDKQISLPVTVHALVRADLDDPAAAAEAVIADIKKAIEQDHNLGGLLKARGLVCGTTTSAMREQGSEYVGGTVSYELLFAEKWGAP